MTDKEIRGVAVYCRVSSEQQAEGDTIQSQKVELPKWCKEKGWEVVAEYEDDGLSAKTTDRPEFQQLLADIEIGTYDAVVVRDFSRLSRDFGDAVSVLSLVLRKGNCAVASEGDGSIIYPHSGIMDYMLYGLKAYASEEENKRRSKAVKAGLVKNKRNNWFCGGTAPFGVRWINIKIDENGHEVPVRKWARNETEIVTLRLMSKLLRSGMSTKLVAAKLNESLERYPTKQAPSTKRKIAVLKEKLRAEPDNPKLKAKLEKAETRLKKLKWGGATVWSLFQSDHLFTGKNKDKTINYGIKLLTKKEVMEIRDKLSRKRRSGARRKKLGRRYNFLLRRIVECEECGWHLAIQDVNRRSKYYR